MNYRQLNEKLDFVLNEISDELKNRVIDARKKQLQDLENEVNNNLANFDSRIEKKQQELDKNKKHMNFFTIKANKPIPIARINGELLYWESVANKNGEPCYKLTSSPEFKKSECKNIASWVDNCTKKVSEYKYVYYQFSKDIYYDTPKITSLEFIDEKLSEKYYLRNKEDIMDAIKAKKLLDICPEFFERGSKEHWSLYTPTPTNEALIINEEDDTIPIAKINGALVQWEFYDGKDGATWYKMTGLPKWGTKSDVRYERCTGSKEGQTFWWQHFKKDLPKRYEQLAGYLYDHVDYITSIEFIEEKLKEELYNCAHRDICEYVRNKIIFDSCPDILNWALRDYTPKYGSKNESFNINEVSDDLIKRAAEKAKANDIEINKELDNLDDEKKNYYYSSKAKLNRLKRKISDLEGMRDKKDIEQRAERRNYVYALSNQPEKDKQIAQKKLRAVKKELPTQFGQCKYFLRTEDALLLKYNASTNNIEIWARDAWKEDDDYDTKANSEVFGTMEDTYKYDKNKTTVENVIAVLQDIYKKTDEVYNDWDLDVVGNTADVSGFKIIWNDFNNLDLNDRKTYNLACFNLKYYSLNKYLFM